MGVHKQCGFSIIILFLILPLNISANEGLFEDADKSNDYQNSQTNRFYDLRHTIPGEPDVDYPIYSSVPLTSFSCSQKHEGYYADIESRCQVFRICTHTAHNSAGFGFLCPNGTLFSQRHFVCDWYRNVRCEESERYYEKNVVNHVGNNYDMMETVRQMIEYPMKTITKALQPNHLNVVKTPTTTTQQTKKSNANYQAVTNTKMPPTSYKTFDSNRNTPTRRYTAQTTLPASKEEHVKSSPVNRGSTEEVYVNSLGELSTDPGSKFDPANAHIIAKASKNSRRTNFAESINFGLNDYVGTVKNAQKIVRGAKNEANVQDNLHLLKHEILAELDTKVSGYQVQAPQKTNFQYLSRGFSSKTNKSYHYQTPKTTKSTVQIMSNELSKDNSQESNTITHSHKIPALDEDSKHSVNVTPLNTMDSLHINAELFDLFKNFGTDETLDESVDEETLLAMKETSTEAAKSTTTTKTKLIDTVVPIYIRFVGDAENSQSAVDITENPKISTTEEMPSQTTQIDNDTITTTVKPAVETTTLGITLKTSTEMVTEVNMVETRVRSNYRRFNTQRNRTTTTTTTTTKPKTRRIPLRRVLATEQPNIENNSVYRHQSLRKSRRTTTTTETPTQLNLPTDVAAHAENRKIITRNINKSTENIHNRLINNKSTITSRYKQSRRKTNTNKLLDLQANGRHRKTILRSRANTTTTTTTSTPTPLTTSATETVVEEILAQNLHFIPLNVSNINAIDSAFSTTTAISPTTTEHAQNQTHIELSSLQTENFLPFNQLTRAILDESILQNYRSIHQPTQQQQTNRGTLSHTTNKSKVLPDKPSIYIARAEGQRIPSNGVQPQEQHTKITTPTSYVSLNDFLNSKFGQTSNKKSYFPTQQAQQQKSQINYYQQQPTYYNLPQQIKQNTNVPYQQQLPIFTNKNFATNNFYQTKTLPNRVVQNNAFQNIKLPTLVSGLIPAAYTQVAQRKSDNFNFELETTPATKKNYFIGASSYDVPLNSVGRLPNDITQRLRRAKM